MKFLKSHFVFNKSQQNGIFVLLGLIVVLQLIYFFYPFSSEAEVDAEHQQLVERLQASVDSLRKAAAEDKAPEMALFNPNFISDYKGYLLGMSVEEIDRLHDYRDRERWINSAEDFQKVTQVSDSLLKAISPFFRFPEFVQRNAEKQAVSKKAFSEPLSKADLNSATAEELQRVNGIGEKLSDRIVKYRSSIGGFRGVIQLQDVYGLSPEVIERVNRQFDVQTSFDRKNLQTISVIELSELPYFNYELARTVVNFREASGGIGSFAELTELKAFPAEKIDRIKLYLTID